MSAAKNPKEAGPRPPREEANTTTVRFEITLGWLRDLHRRVERRQLEDADWPFIGALVSKQIARAEARQTRMLATIAQDAAARKDEQGLDADINATALYWETPNGPIILFYTGRHHAGEIVDQVLRRRLVSGPKLVKCSDGASKNFGKRLSRTTWGRKSHARIARVGDGRRTPPPARPRPGTETRSVDAGRTRHFHCTVVARLRLGSLDQLGRNRLSLVPLPASPLSKGCPQAGQSLILHRFLLSTAPAVSAEETSLERSPWGSQLPER
jgi:hypothetical protein